MTPEQMLDLPFNAVVRYTGGNYAHIPIGTLLKRVKAMSDDADSVGFTWGDESDYEYFEPDEIEFLTEEAPSAVAACGTTAHFTTEPVALTGGSVDYYKFLVEDPTTAEEPYSLEVNDFIESAGMNFAEGNVVKAIARIAGIRNGKGKPGVTGVYDAEKVVFFGDRILKQQQRMALN